MWYDDDVSAAAIAKKMLALGACPEGREWIEKTNQADFRQGWKVCPAPEFMCWLLTRLLATAGVKACVACSKAAAQLHDDPLLKQTLTLCDVVIDGRSKDLAADTTKLQVLAYDATESALKTKKPSGPALLSVAYAAYAVHYAVMSGDAKDPALKLKHLLKAAQHASDAASHAQKGLPPKAGLASLVRATIADDVVVKAWAAAAP